MDPTRNRTAARPPPRRLRQSPFPRVLSAQLSCPNLGAGPLRAQVQSYQLLSSMTSRL